MNRGNDKNFSTIKDDYVRKITENKRIVIWWDYTGSHSALSRGLREGREVILFILFPPQLILKFPLLNVGRFSYYCEKRSNGIISCFARGAL